MPSVVVIDDDDDLRLLLRVTLEQAGFDIVGEAGDGRAGYELATQLLPDVIVLDLIMAAPDGVDLLPKLRTVARDSPVVVLTADDLAGVEELVLALGAHTFLRKPTSIARLASALLDAAAAGRPLAS